MFKLHKLEKAGEARKRVGRGGKRGGTSGRGKGGQKSRTGAGVGVLFEGGQMPLVRRLPKRGFSNARFAQEVEIINIGMLDRAFDSGAEVTLEQLASQGYIKGKKGSLVKILGQGEFTKKLVVYAHGFSESARKAIEGQGGEARVITER